MTRAHDVKDISLAGTVLSMRVDGKPCQIDLASQSKKLAQATPEQRAKFELSPSGYGIHWPELDEDLSIDGMLGVKRMAPRVAAAAG